VVLNKVPAALGVLVLERQPDGRFASVGEVPSWCRELLNPDLRWELPFTAEDIFPFLSAFLPEAERAWGADPPGRADSDIWTEVDRGGREFHLESTALTIDEASVLVITRNDLLFHIRQNFLQRARELRMTHRALMREVEEKDILVHSIVHDLAAPLHSMMGVLSLLIEEPLAKPSADWVKTGMHAATRQRELITEILEAYSADGNALAPRAAHGVDVSSVVARVAAERAPVAKQRNIALVTKPPSHEVRVVAEETRLFRVLANLLDNAYRHSQPGGTVTLTVSHEEDSVRLSIDDEGPGVSPELLPRLFEKFSRGRDGGTGLGLFYCRITVERWGGGIGYEPRAEGGARFWIRLRVRGSGAGGGERGTHGEAAARG
jgi:signal transduction histidine kinase